MINENIEYSWLGLGDTEKIIVDNPLIPKTEFDIENPDIFLLSLMSKPEYFGLTCKYILNKELMPFQLSFLKEFWIRPFPMIIGSRGCSKSYTLAIYCILRALFNQGSKIVICGAGFRQSKVVFEYIENIWNDAPVLRDLVGTTWNGRENGAKHEADKWIFRIGESSIVALPLGSGEKIRGQRAGFIIAEEFASIQVEVFETVVSGFAAVSADPVQKFKLVAKHRKLQKLGIIPEDQEPEVNSNQTIISGTASYTFNHFYDYWKKWKTIIESKGDASKMKEIFPNNPPKGFNWKDYSIIRMPFEKLPEGFMDAKTVSKAKATVNAGVYACEYSAIFTGDSTGFFKRSLIESCVVGKPNNPIIIASYSDAPIEFTAKLMGTPGKQYLIAVDPAAENDNFSIVILELYPEHRRVVYCWTTNKKKHQHQLKIGVANENDYYGYCARKIRSLLQLFPGEIAIDSQGGGGAIIEALHSNERILPGEVPIWPAIKDGEFKESDRYPGLHIIHIINFASATWTSSANHGLRLDLESKALLFPMFDSALLGLAMETDKISGRVDDETGDYIASYDTLEDTMLEIEELKNELATIVHTQTGKSKRDHWDTPEYKIGEKKGRLRKDRYSSLLMANAVGRDKAEELMKMNFNNSYEVIGGFVKDLSSKRKEEKTKEGQGPKWYVEKMKSLVNVMGRCN